jgi:hypothetical protein
MTVQEKVMSVPPLSVTLAFMGSRLSLMLAPE